MIDEGHTDEKFEEPIFSVPGDESGEQPLSGAVSDEQGGSDEPVFPAPEETEPYFTPAQEQAEEDAPPSVTEHGSEPPSEPPVRPIGPGRGRPDRSPAPKVPSDWPRSPRRLGRTGPFWVLGGVLAAVVVVLAWFALRGGGEPSPDSEPPPVAGVAGSVTLEPGPTPTLSEPTSTPTPPRLEVGAQVIVGDTEGDGIRLRNEPGLNGITLAIFQDGAPFVVMDAGSEFSQYPVEADGYRWYRIRATGGEDAGLVGWAAGEFLVPVEVGE